MITRRSLGKLALGLLGAAALFGAQALAQDAPPAPLDKPGDVKIALVRYLSTGDFFQAYLSGVEAQAKALGVPIPYVFSTTQTERHWRALCEIVAPEGAVCAIDDFMTIEIGRLKAKSCSFHWEAMFARSMFATPSMIAQHRLLDEVAALVEAGRLRHTLTRHLGRIEATLAAQHEPELARMHVVRTPADAAALHMPPFMTPFLDYAFAQPFG